jgi:hypothetical protein
MSISTLPDIAIAVSFFCLGEFQDFRGHVRADRFLRLI